MRSEGFWESLGFREIRSFYEITWIFGDFLSYELFVHNLYWKKKKKQQQQLELEAGSDPIFYYSTTRITLSDKKLLGNPK